MSILANHRSLTAEVLRGRVLKRNLLIASVVGCVLSLANQLDVLMRGPFTPRLFAKILANFLVPFVVSTVSAAISRRG